MKHDYLAFVNFSINFEFFKNSKFIESDIINISHSKLIFDKKPKFLILTDGSLVVLPFIFFKKSVNTQFNNNLFVTYAISHSDHLRYLENSSLL